MRNITKIRISLSIIVSFLFVSFLPELSYPVLAEGIPQYSGQAYYVVNNNTPAFADSDKTRTDAFETYSELDGLGRCGVAYANICKEINKLHCSQRNKKREETENRLDSEESWHLNLQLMIP